MIRISPITKIDNQKHIAILDTSSISFMQKLQEKGVMIGNILCDYELIIIPGWVLIEIEDAEGRAEFVQDLIDKGYPIYSIAEETYTDLAACLRKRLKNGSRCVIMATAAVIIWFIRLEMFPEFGQRHFPV